MATFNKDNKKRLVHPRDEENNLIPQKIEVTTFTEEEKKQLGFNPSEPVEILVEPMTQGEINKLSMMSAEEEDTGKEITEQDYKVIKHIIDPEKRKERGSLFTKKDLPNDYEIVLKLIAAVMDLSVGADQNEVVEEDNVEEVVEEESFQDGE